MQLPNHSLSHENTRRAAPGPKPSRWHWMPEVHFQNWHLNLPHASLLGSSPTCTAAVLPCHASRVFIAVQARLELLDMPFILLQPAGLMGQVCVHASPPPFLYPVPRCNGHGVREIPSSSAYTAFTVGIS